MIPRRNQEEKKDNNEVEVLDVETHDKLEEAKPINADDAKADDEEDDEGNEDDSGSGHDFRVDINSNLRKEAEDDKNCEVTNSTEEYSTELDDEGRLSTCMGWS